MEALDFANNTALLLSARLKRLRKKTERLAEEVARVDLNLNATKCKTLRYEHARCGENIAFKVEEVKDVEEFVYVGAIVFREGGDSNDVYIRTEYRRRMLNFRECGGSEARGLGRRTKICLSRT